MVKSILQTKKQTQVGHLEVTASSHIFLTRIKHPSTLKALLTSNARDSWYNWFKELMINPCISPTQPHSCGTQHSPLKAAAAGAVGPGLWLCCSDARRLARHLGTAGQGPVRVTSQISPQSLRGGAWPHSQPIKSGRPGGLASRRARAPLR